MEEKRKEFKINRAFLEHINNNPINKFRLFDKKDYGYWKAVSNSQLSSIWCSDCSIPMSAFRVATTSHISYLQRIFNCEQLALEAHKVRETIKKEAEKSLEYVRKKKYLTKEDLKVMESSKKSVNK